MSNQHRLDHTPFIVPPGKKIRLAEYDPGYTAGFSSKKEGKKALKHDVKDLAAAQELLWASKQYAVLIIFQAMDAAGKDGTIKHVMTGVNPQGVDVYSFKAPTEEEKQFHFLMRPMRKLPAHGRIAIFNRSYYEEVLVVRVHPSFLQSQWMPRRLHGASLEEIWQARYESINAFEQMVANLKMILSGDAKIGNAALLASAIDELETIRELDTVECHPNLLAGVALLLQTYQISNDQVMNELVNTGCDAQIAEFEALNGIQLTNLDPACHKQMIDHIVSKLKAQEIEFSQQKMATATSEEIKIWMVAVLNGIRNLAADSPDTNLQNQIATDIASLEKLIMPPPPNEYLEKLKENADFVFIWMKYVGATLIVASIVAIWFTYETEREYDEHLPRPVFYTVSHMTQTAKWEINRTLEPRGLAEHIQWMKVERNREGGINLTGLFRDPPDLKNGEPTDKVLAQEYVIITDPWCYIRSTTIEDKPVDRPAGGPAFVVPEDAHPDTAERSTPVRVRW
jgi:hypothetical protein